MNKRLFAKYLFCVGLFCIINFTSNAQWSQVGTGVSGGYVYALYPYDSVLYVGGSFTGPSSNLLQWDSTKFSDVGGGVNGSVYSFFEYKKSLYVGGWFNHAGIGNPTDSFPNLAGWNGSKWFQLAEGAYDQVNAFDTINFFLVLDNGYYPGLGEWNGSVWKSILGNGLGGGMGYDYLINSFAWYKGYLYAATSGRYFKTNQVGGYLYQLAGYVYKLIPDSNKWDKVATMLDGTNYSIALSLAVYNNKLYIGGTFDSANGSPANDLITWNGDSISTVGIGVNGTVSALTVYDSTLYIGGLFDSAGGVPANNIVCWNDTVWSALGDGVNNQVFALTSFKGALYVGGGFTSPGNYIAKYTPLPKNTAVNSINVLLYPDPSNGVFTVTSENIHTGDQMEIYTLLGQKVSNVLLNNNSTTVYLTNCASGLYFYRVINTEGEQMATGVFVVIKPKY